MGLTCDDASNAHSNTHSNTSAAVEILSARSTATPTRLQHGSQHFNRGSQHSNPQPQLDVETF